MLLVSILCFTLHLRATSKFVILASNSTKIPGDITCTGTQDSTQIARAIQLAMPNGSVLFTDGVFYATESIKMASGNVDLIGMGENLTIVRFFPNQSMVENSTDDSQIRFQNSGIEIFNSTRIMVQGFQLELASPLLPINNISNNFTLTLNSTNLTDSSQKESSPPSFPLPTQQTTSSSDFNSILLLKSDSVSHSVFSNVRLKNGSAFWKNSSDSIIYSIITTITLSNSSYGTDLELETSGNVLNVSGSNGLKITACKTGQISLHQTNNSLVSHNFVLSNNKSYNVEGGISLFETFDVIVQLNTIHNVRGNKSIVLGETNNCTVVSNNVDGDVVLNVPNTGLVIGNQSNVVAGSVGSKSGASDDGGIIGSETIGYGQNTTG